MSSVAEKRIKKDREIVLELETQIKEIKHQLNEQLRCLDQRFEAHYCMVWELQDFYQRRAEVELEYARNLDKLVKQIMMRHRAEKQRREQWPAYSTYRLWQTMLELTTKQSRSHNALADVFSSVLTSKFSQILEDMQRIYKKCRDIAVGTHGELTKVATELHSSMKTYHVYHEESRQTQSKLERVQSERVRVEQESKKSLPSKRVQRYEKQTEKRQNKFSESNAKATKARNEYILSMVSANAAIRKFIVDDLPELINTMDYGYHVSLGQLKMASVAAEKCVCDAREASLQLIASKAKDLNQREDRQAFLQLYHKIFSLPKKFEFQPHKGDPDCEVSAQKSVIDDLSERLNTITDRLHSLKVENEELWKTLETTDNALLERLMATDIDIESLIEVPDKELVKPTVDSEKQKAERLETELYYLNKFREYQNNTNLIARLQAKCNVIEKALNGCKGGQFRPMSVAPKRKRPLGKYALEARPKLFGGSIEEYVQATGQEIPAIITSCTRIINLYGMHHQGVFRVSGAQHEINDFKMLFERGEEPLLGKVGSRDINSVAGVLKLYFRELREPLFPVQLFDELIACSKIDVNVPDDLRKCLLRLQELLLPLPRPVVIVTRYLFSFLNHLSEYSDENMMDPYNLAVCFGPTLLPVPADRDQVRYQNYVNELIRILICYQEKIFLNDGGPVYERCIVEDDADLEDSLDSLLEDAGPEGTGSEDDLDAPEREAVVLYDFNPRTAKELPLKKGEKVMIRSRISSDWWEGSTSDGKKGLVAHRFIALQLRPITDKPDSVIDGGSIRTSTESLPAVKMLSLVGSTVLPPVCDTEPLDRSVSQPNICGEGTLSVIVPASPTVLASCSSTSSDLSRGGYASADSLGSLSSKDDIISPSPVADADTKPTADLVVDFKSADSSKLSVEDDSNDRCPSLSTSLEPTPDLVLNLPTANSVSVTVRPLSPPLTTAEVFASAEHGTIKKNTGIDRSSSSTIDPVTNTFDEVFPSTPREINEALDVNGFSFELLPPPPPRLLEMEISDVQLMPSLVHVESSSGEDFPLKFSNAQVANMSNASVVDAGTNQQSGNGLIVDCGSGIVSSGVIKLPDDSVEPMSNGNSREMSSADVVVDGAVLCTDIGGEESSLDTVTRSKSLPGYQSLQFEVACPSSVTLDQTSIPINDLDAIHIEREIEMLGQVTGVTEDQFSVKTDQSDEVALGHSAGRLPDLSSDVAIDLAPGIISLQLDDSVTLPQSPVNNAYLQMVLETGPVTNGQQNNVTIGEPSLTQLEQVPEEATLEVSADAKFVATADSQSVLAVQPTLAELVISHQVGGHSLVAQSFPDKSPAPDQATPSLPAQSVAPSVLSEPLTSHRAAPSLHAHSAVLEMLTKQHEVNEELAKQSPSDKSKTKPPPVMKKPSKHQAHDVTRQQ